MRDLSGEGLARLAARALDFVRDGAVVGLGSGQAAGVFLRALAAQVEQGRVVRGVSTSEATTALARELGVPLIAPGDAAIDLTVDGADEVDPALDLIKGYGGALVRERIVAAASVRRLILVGAEKLVPVLGSRGRLPLEVVPFAVALVLERLGRLGFTADERRAEGRPLLSDNGNALVDCAVGPIADPVALERALRAIPGVVDTGLFLGMADTVLVADGDAVRELVRQQP